MQIHASEPRPERRKLIGLFGGPVVCILVLLSTSPDVIPPAAAMVAALALLMAIWWITEAIPIPATALLPIVASLAAGAGVHPGGPMAAATLAASFAFMLPVATPPNAIVYGSRQVSIPQMARAGFWLNLSGIAVIIAFVTFLLPLLWGVSTGTAARGLQHPSPRGNP